MNQELRDLFLYLSGLAALGFGMVGLLLAFGNVLLQSCCNSVLITNDSVLYALGGRIWFPVLWAGLGIAILMLTVKRRS
ncbi:MAG: hypothetical protein HKN13_02500 [Rhodothermales bacterium]|nr:hypothetical protein [Rhodothermales bacterium]